MRTGAARLTGAALVGLVSIAAAGWSLASQIEEEGLTAGRRAWQIAPLPENLLPASSPLPPELPALSTSERRAIGRGLWREPLEPRLFNLLFADSVRIGRPDRETDRLAALLAQLGWRYTPAQQNLMIRALLDERFGDVLDRVDALLRRQRQPALAYTVLAALEGIPQIHGEVLDKLLAEPAWRSDYLSVIGPESAPALLEARVRTIDALLKTRSGMNREEIAPSLIALNASGRGRIAHGLWVRQAGEPADANLVHDPVFEQVAAQAGTAGPGIPFEWRLGQDLGYAAQTSSLGVSISWDRRGVPAFLSQTVPVRPGRDYVLTVQGRASDDSLQRLLSPLLLCATRAIRFEPAGEARQGQPRWRTGPLPASCDMGVLTLNGALDTGSGTVTIDLERVSLQFVS